MRGRLTIIPVSGAVSSQELAAPPALEDLRAGLNDRPGGPAYAEVVPLFKTYKGQRCVAFCDEDGKRKGLKLNQRASLYWFRQHPWPKPDDVLVGPVVIVTGDDELMEEL